MKISAELSLYPLEASFEEIILDFVNALKQYSSLEIKVNGMSTHVFGEYDLLMEALRVETKKIYEERQAILVIKLGRGELKYSPQKE